MFTKYHAALAAALIGAAAFLTPIGTASAAALPRIDQDAGQAAQNGALLQDVSHRWSIWRDRHHWYGDYPWRYRHFGFHAPFYFSGPLYHRHRSGSAHVRWCLNRYRSYDPWDNTWVAYSGRVRYCRSPYRY